MKVAINTLFYKSGHNYGTGTYLIKLLDSLHRKNKAKYHLILSRGNQVLRERYPMFSSDIVPISGDNRPQRILFEQTRLERWARAAGCDVLFCPGYMGPIYGRMPMVLTIHDCQFRDIPKLLGFSMKVVYNIIVPRAARRAKQVATISDFSRQRIIHHLGVSPEKVTRIYSGPSFARENLPQPTDQNVLNKFGLTRPFLFSSASDFPHKNFTALLACYAKAREELGDAYDFVIIGHERKSNVPGAIFVGFVSDEERDVLYRQAHAYILGSLYEGFGLTLLEAMQSGIPIASSPLGSLREVGGDACLWFDPLESTSIKDAIIKILTNKEVRVRCLAKNKTQWQKFSWEKTAEKLEELFIAAVKCD